jgi:hypothetical protein
METGFFRVDPYYIHLRGEDSPSRPRVWGTNFLAYPTGELGAEFAERYNRMLACAEEVLAGTGLRMYPLAHLHITIGA